MIQYRLKIWCPNSRGKVVPIKTMFKADTDKQAKKLFNKMWKSYHRREDARSATLDKKSGTVWERVVSIS